LRRADPVQHVFLWRKKKYLKDKKRVWQKGKAVKEILTSLYFGTPMTDSGHMRPRSTGPFSRVTVGKNLE
jgi:hypothetical protein